MVSLPGRRARAQRDLGVPVAGAGRTAERAAEILGEVVHPAVDDAAKIAHGVAQALDPQRSILSDAIAGLGRAMEAEAEAAKKAKAEAAGAVVQVGDSTQAGPKAAGVAFEIGAKDMRKDLEGMDFFRNELLGVQTLLEDAGKRLNSLTGGLESHSRGTEKTAQALGDAGAKLAGYGNNA